MREIHRQELLNVIETLREAHSEVKKSLLKKQNAVAKDLLSQCQECALSIGNSIESFEGENFVTIAYLEEYCDELFQIYELIDESVVNENRVYKRLEKQIEKIENSIKNDITIRKEIVFLPYKYSMWDAMESIYLAAKEDPNVDAYCIPIPYYDMKSNREFGEMHYEGADYPESIHAIDWRSYNLEERKPDMIFIHNPYDDWNLVTSVHPRYYSNHLKAVTDTLVYVPYFVLDEISPDDCRAVQGMKHFCFLPGIMNADKVILQSEDMRQIYVDEYQKAAKINGLTGKHIDREALEEKFLGLGSPKFDKVNATVRNDMELPQSWKKKIYTAEGKRKKVVLYNTSVGTLISNDAIIDKIGYTLDLMKSQKDIVLLWRPHPLYEATLESMKPVLLSRYREIVRKYMEGDWGIFDDSSDLNRAITQSDAYYGDISSVVSLYRKTGKPIMIQNEYAIPEIMDSISVADIIEIQNEWWFYSFKDNSIYRMDKETLEANLVVRLAHDICEKRVDVLYDQLFWYGNKIIVKPCSEASIAVYDMVCGDLNYIQHRTNLEVGSIGFSDGAIDKGILYLLALNGSYILNINLDTLETNCTDLKWNGITNNANEMFVDGKILLYEGRILFTCLFHEGVIAANVETGELELFECEGLENGGSGIWSVGEDIYILAREGNQIIRWKKGEQNVNCYKNFPEGYNSMEYGAKDWSFYKTAVGQKLYLLPRSANMVLGIDGKSGEMAQLLEGIDFTRDSSYLGKYSPFMSIAEQGEEVYIFEALKGKVFVRKANGEVEERRIWIKQENNVDNPPIPLFERMNRKEALERYLQSLENKNLELETSKIGEGIYARIVRK